MIHPAPEHDEGSLLATDRQLTAEEMLKLRRLTDRTWLQFGQLIRDRAQDAYAVASTADFGRCVQEHLEPAGWAEMVVAEAYSCPVCGRLLKDRRSPSVASSILLERSRLAALWLQVEEAEGQDRTDATARFRRALGL